MRIAFAGSPDLGLSPAPHLAVGLATRAIGLRLAAKDAVTIYRSDLGLGVGAPDGMSYRDVATASPWHGKPLSALDRASAMPPFSRALFGSPLYYPRYAARLAKSLAHERADVLHLHNFFQAISRIRAHNPRLTIVLHMHCEWLEGVRPAFGNAQLAGADLILGCSEYVSGKIRKRYPRHAARVRTLFNGVDLDCFRPGPADAASRGPRIVFAGRISPEKGLHVLLDAMRYVVAEFPQARLDIIGPDAAQPAQYLAALRDPLVDPRDPAFASVLSGHYGRKLRARANAELPSNVIFSRGGLPQDELSERFARATLLVNPSLVETFGMSALEAMASGLPVVATRVGGTPEVVRDGETGLLVAPNDARALAAAICTVIGNPQGARAMGARGRQIAQETFGWDRITASYETMLGAAHVTQPADRPALGAALPSS